MNVKNVCPNEPLRPHTALLATIAANDPRGRTTATSPRLAGCPIACAPGRTHRETLARFQALAARAADTPTPLGRYIHRC